MTPEQLREWRKARGLTQQQLADLAGVTTRAVIHWEQGTRPIPKLLEIYTEEH